MMNVLAIVLNDVIFMVTKSTNEVIWRDSRVKTLNVALLREP